MVDLTIGNYTGKLYITAHFELIGHSSYGI
jgi:hypothetical protein